jgi:hypothetical protein
MTDQIACWVCPWPHIEQRLAGEEWPAGPIRRRGPLVDLATICIVGRQGNISPEFEAAPRDCRDDSAGGGRRPIRGFW